MKQQILKLGLISVFIMFILIGINGQVPQAISFQGVALMRMIFP